MCPGTSYIVSLEGAPLSSPTSGSQRKLLCTVTTSANQVTAAGMRTTSATTSGANVWLSSRGPSNQRKGWCVLVWTCLKTIPIKNDPWSLIRPVRFKQPFNHVLHLNVGNVTHVEDPPPIFCCRGLKSIPAGFRCELWCRVSFITQLQTTFVHSCLINARKHYISHQLSNASEEKLPV